MNPANITTSPTSFREVKSWPTSTEDEGEDIRTLSSWCKELLGEDTDVGGGDEWVGSKSARFKQLFQYDIDFLANTIIRLKTFEKWDTTSYPSKYYIIFCDPKILIYGRNLVICMKRPFL